MHRLPSVGVVSRNPTGDPPAPSEEREPSMGGGPSIRAAGPQTGTAVSGPRAQPGGRGVAATNLVRA
eukprot:13831721-Alexandrium_andersonii.AAC.1